MRNLEQLISKWRQQMRAAGIRSHDVLDELESHLREGIDDQTRSGKALEPAFENAVQCLGAGRALKREFDQIENQERKYMKRGIIIAAGIIGVLVGMALVMPAVAQYRREGVMRNDEPWLFLIGSLMTLAGCGAAIRSLRRTRA